MSNKPDLSFLSKLPTFQAIGFDWEAEQFRFNVNIGFETFSFSCGSRGCQDHEHAEKYIAGRLKFNGELKRTFQLIAQGRIKLNKNRHDQRTQEYVSIMGSLCRPQPADFLYCALMDMDAGAESHEDFCANFGYDTDSIKARDTYMECQRNGAKLRKLYTPAEIEKLREALQDF